MLSSGGAQQVGGGSLLSHGSQAGVAFQICCTEAAYLHWLLETGSYCFAGNEYLGLMWYPNHQGGQGCSLSHPYEDASPLLCRTNDALWQSGFNLSHWRKSWQW